MAKAAVGPVPVIVMGLGFIGQEIARAAASSPELQLVGAVELAPPFLGQELGRLLGRSSLGVPVVSSLEEAVGKRRGAVLLHATGSRLPDVANQLLEACRLGVSVVSTCEELAFPYLRHPGLADKLDRAATKAGVALLGTGVNPGFVLDRLVATAGQVCGEVRRVKAVRIVDARTRREALQRKVGAGLFEEEFQRFAEREAIGHVGLVESAALAALGLGIDVTDFDEELLPVIAEEDVEGAAFPVKKGRVAGIFQSAVGLDGDQERVRLELTIAVGAGDPVDRIEIDADPGVVLEIKGGVAGDRATANVVVNAAPRIRASEPGLLTVLELPAGR